MHFANSSQEIRQHVGELLANCSRFSPTVRQQFANGSTVGESLANCWRTSPTLANSLPTIRQQVGEVLAN
jgi:hypothetical protein